MKVDFNKIYFGVKFVVITAFVVLLAFLFWQKGAVGAGISYDIAPLVGTKFVYGLYPEGRVEIVDNAWKLKYEPVYLRVYAPRKFKTAQVTMKYQNPNDKLQMFVGVKVKGNSAVPYYMQKIEKTLPGSWGEKTLEFDLTGAANEKNKLQFIIAAPGIEQSTGAVIIENVKIQLL